MIQASTLTIPPERRYIWRALGWLAALAAAVGVATVLGMLTTQVSAPSEPRGVIMYTTPQGAVAVRPNGERVTVTDVAPLVTSDQPGAIGEEFPAPDGQAVAFIEHAGDGTWLVVREDASVQRVAQLTGPSLPSLVGGDKPVVRAAEGVPLVVAWSPDARFLAYGSVSGFPYVLNVAERGTWSQHKYGLRDGFVGELVWSPDGRYLAVSSYSEDGKDHTAYVLDGSSGSLSRLIDGCRIVWSPDSRYLALHRDAHRDPGLWLVSVDGQQTQRLTANPDAFPSTWLPD